MENMEKSRNLNLRTSKGIGRKHARSSREKKILVVDQSQVEQTAFTSTAAEDSTGVGMDGNGWEWGNGIIINDYYEPFPHSLRLAPVRLTYY